MPFRVIIGAGKYENITGGNSDYTDTAKMSLYNLRDTIQFDQLGGTSWSVNANTSTWTLPVTASPPVFGGATFADPNLTGLGIHVRSNCEPTRTTYRCIGATDATTPLFQGSSARYPSDSGCDWWAQGPPGSSTTIQHKGCHWTTVSGNDVVAGDCCEGTCPGTCWACVFDLLQPGERVIGKPLIAGGLVFFTSFTPTNTASTDACQAGGTGYLYAFDYQCGAFPQGFLPIQDHTVITEQFGPPGGDVSTESGSIWGRVCRANLYLDPTGQNIIIQESTAQLKKSRSKPVGKDEPDSGLEGTTVQLKQLILEGRESPKWANIETVYV